MPIDEVSAWETYEEATAKHARQLTYRRKSVQVEHGGRQSVRLSASAAPGRQSVVVSSSAVQSHSVSGSLAGIDRKMLEKAADEADAERAARRSTAYSTQYSQFFDQLGFGRRRGDLDDIEEAFAKRDLSFRVKEDILVIFSVYFEGHVHFEERQREMQDSRFRTFLKTINGTMPWIQGWIQNRMPLPGVFVFIEICLRGIGQVVFQNNPVCGLLILIGLFVQSTRIAIHGLIGLISGTLTAYALGFDKGLKRSGLFGYNSLLCGLAMATFFSVEKHQGYDAAVAIAVIIFSCFSSVLFIFMGKLFVPYKSPPFTLPFNMSVLMYLLATANMSRVNTGSVRVPMLPEYDAEFETTITASAFFAGCIRGVGQIFLADSIASGALVLAGIAVCSRIGATAALGGSALGSAVALASGVPGTAIEGGMYGFNASLTVTAMYMFYTPSRGAFVLATLAGIMTVLGQQSLDTLLEPYGLPFMTLPFCVITLPFVVLQGTTSLLIAVPLSSMTVPEDHLKKVQYLTEGFEFLKEALYPENAKDFRKKFSRSNKLNKSLKRISKILDAEDDKVDEIVEDEASLSSSRHSNRSKAHSISVNTPNGTTFFQQLKNKWRKKTIKGSWVLKAAPRIFKALDTKRSGSIVLEDFTAALRTVGLNDKSGLRFASLVFDIMDYDKSNSIEKKEWVVFCLVSLELMAVRKKISKFFDFVDLDGNEFIDFEELDAALDYLGEQPLTEADRDTLLSVLTVEEEEEGIDIIELINYVTLAKIKAMVEEYLEQHAQSIRSVEFDGAADPS